MKKLFFIAAIAGAALVSCTKNELAPSATKQYELTFASPVTQVVTKADLAPATYPEGTPFAVYADHHFKDYTASDVTFTSYMRGSEGVDVTYKTTEFTLDGKTFNNYWAPTSKYYWPMDGYLTFAAYSPSTAKNNLAISYTQAKGVETDYTTPAVASQYDLMLSDRAVNQIRTSMVQNVTDGTESTTFDGVHIAFKHVLSAVSFAVKTNQNYTNDGYTITLNSLTLKNAFSEGHLTQFADGKAQTTVDLTKVWSNVKTENTTGYAVCSSDVALSTTAKTWAPADDADLVMIPQALTHDTNKVEVEIVYTVHHTDMGATGIQYTKSLPLATTAVGSWVPSTRYLYTIIIGMEEIVFAPTVTDWTNTDPIEIPENTIIPTPGE